MKRTLFLAAALLCLAGCSDMIENEAVSVRTVKAVINAEVDDVTSEPTVKVTFDGERLVWEGEESLAVIIGNNSSKTGSPTTYSVQELPTVAGVKGQFAGELTFSDPFTEADIVGVVYPYSEYCWTRYFGGQRIVMLVGASEASTARVQVQHRNNVLNGENAPLMAAVSSADLRDGDGFVARGLKLEWGCSLIRFNVYGRCEGMEDGEILKSVSLVSDSGKGIVGSSEYVISSGEYKFNAYKSNPVTVSLEDECTVADKTESDGIKLFAAVLPRGEGISFSKVTVTTDKAEYVMNVSRLLDLNPGKISLVGLNLYKFTRNQL